MRKGLSEGNNNSVKHWKGSASLGRGNGRVRRVSEKG